MKNKEYQRIKEINKQHGSLIKIRISEENKQALIKRAVKEGCSVSDIARDIISEATKAI